MLASNVVTLASCVTTSAHCGFLAARPVGSPGAISGGNGTISGGNGTISGGNGTISGIGGGLAIWRRNAATITLLSVSPLDRANPFASSITSTGNSKLVCRVPFVGRTGILHLPFKQ